MILSTVAHTQTLSSSLLQWNRSVYYNFNIWNNCTAYINNQTKHQYFSLGLSMDIHIILHCKSLTLFKGSIYPIISTNDWLQPRYTNRWLTNQRIPTILQTFANFNLPPSLFACSRLNHCPCNRNLVRTWSVHLY